MILVVSLLALLVGPCLVGLARRRQSTTLSLDAFVLTAVAGMVILHVLPEAVGRAGFWALGAALVGLVIPLLVERGMRPGGATKAFVIGLALLGMGIHAALDGIALTAEDSHGHVLAWAVILHRIPVGLGIWWIVARTLGRRIALLTLTVTAVGTCIGYGLGPDIWSAAGLRTAGLLEALLAGSLIHIVLHSDVPAPGGVAERRGLHWASLGGVLAALVVLRFVLAHEHHHGPAGGHTHGADALGGHDHDRVHAQDEAGADVVALPEPGEEFSLGTVSEVFLDLVLESAPILVLAYLFVGLLHVFLPSTWVDRMNARTSIGQAFRGVAVGLPLPVCSCGVVPIYRGLVQKGAAAASALAFLVATPELEVAAIALTAKLMGGEFAVARLLSAAILALVVGTLVGRYATRLAGRGSEAGSSSPAAEGGDSDGGDTSSSEVSCCASKSAGDSATVPLAGAADASDAADGEPRPFGARLREAVRFGFTDAVDDTLPWIVFGLGIAALLSPVAQNVDLGALPSGIEVPIAALLGLPIYVCASGSTPIAAFMLLQGVSPGAVLAFLLTGPATNATTFGVVSDAHGRRVAWAFTASMLGLSIALGLLTNVLVSTSVQGEAAAAHDHGGSSGAFAIAVFAVSGLFVAGSLLRLGVRGFLGKLFKGPGPGGGGHSHDHGSEAESGTAHCH